MAISWYISFRRKPAQPRPSAREAETAAPVAAVRSMAVGARVPVAARGDLRGGRHGTARLRLGLYSGRRLRNPGRRLRTCYVDGHGPLSLRLGACVRVARSHGSGNRRGGYRCLLGTGHARGTAGRAAMAQCRDVHPRRHDGRESNKRGRRGNQARPEADLLKPGIDGRAKAGPSVRPLVSADFHNTGRYR
jgi:hypothetical protein